jgi:low temperature requirement protein LtrA
MGIVGSSKNLLRKRGGEEEAKVEFVELFFDLVFVFAVTQISHSLLENLTLTGALQTAFLLMSVWWVWIYTSWVTNWLDPQQTAVRLMLFVLMFAGLILSTSIPAAFETRGLSFALAYAAMQLGRTLFMMWALRNHNRGNYLNFCRIAAWLLLSAVLWIAGGLAEGEARYGLWILALFVEYISPALRFWTPWLGASDIEDWNVAGGHLAERCGLFIIIALGESVLVIGATFSGLEWSAAFIQAFVASFAATVAMWFIYFNVGAGAARHHIETSSNPGRIARLAYTYIHVLLVAGIVVTAVADELVLAHPVGHHAELPTILAMIGGPALYLVGNLLFKWTCFGRAPLSHLVGLALLAVLAAFGSMLDPLPLGIATTLILIVVAVWEHVSLQGSAHRQPT